MNLFDSIIAFEEGQLNDDEVILLFQTLIDNGMAWRLQGIYGRTAKYLIENGFCHPQGWGKIEA